MGYLVVEAAMSFRKQLKEFKLANEADRIDTIIGASVVIDGELTSNKAMRIDGIVHGDVKSKGNVITGPESIINGDLTARNITLCGVVNGDVFSSGRVILTSKARVSGDLTTQYIVVDEGALLNGNINMIVQDKKADSINDKIGKSVDNKGE